MKSTDMTRPPNLSQIKMAGPFVSRRPDYQNLLPPCNNGCPAGENIQAWLAYMHDGQIELAWRELTKINPLPAIHGRVCYHPCESACNRAEVDEPVRIHAIERFLGDEALKHKWSFRPDRVPTGKRVLVIGSGPAGLSAAYHLAINGHSVVIYEAFDKPGGMMRYGIPAYRLPRDILDAEIKRIQNMGVQIHLNKKVDDILLAKEEGKFDAVFAAVGAHIGTQVDIPVRDAGKILDAVTYLKNVEQGEAPLLGKRVAVYGGGNTAMDAARTARRLGADEALIIYRRDREHMPAHDFEAEEAEAEGIKINWLRAIKGVEKNQVQVEIMALDEQGKPYGTGHYETLTADSVILALGQRIEAKLFENVPSVHVKQDGSVVVDKHFMTEQAGIFCGGDMTPGVRSVTYATGHGRKAALNIDAWLQERRYQKTASPPLAKLESLHLWYETAADSRQQKQKAAEQRVDNFAEVLEGFDTDAAYYEAKRCYSCGNCFECDGCFGACPEGAIEIMGKGKGYKIHYEKCTGCGACVDQCPTNAIDFVALTTVNEEPTL